MLDGSIEHEAEPDVSHKGNNVRGVPPLQCHYPFTGGVH